jgi:hypothetical protein
VAYNKHAALLAWDVYSIENRQELCYFKSYFDHNFILAPIVCFVEAIKRREEKNRTFLRPSMTLTIFPEAMGRNLKMLKQ